MHNNYAQQSCKGEGRGFGEGVGVGSAAGSVGVRAAASVVRSACSENNNQLGEMGEDSEDDEGFAVPVTEEVVLRALRIPLAPQSWATTTWQWPSSLQALSLSMCFSGLRVCGHMLEDATAQTSSAPCSLALCGNRPHQFTGPCCRIASMALPPTSTTV